MSGCRLGGGIQVEVVRWRGGCRGEVGRKEKTGEGVLTVLTGFYITGVFLGW